MTDGRDVIPLDGLPNDLPGYEALVREFEKRLFDGIRTWSEFEIRFLRGRGLKANTYSSLRSGIKQFFSEYLRMEFSPFRVTIEMVEAYFDWETERNSQQTASIRVGQLRGFFNRFVEQYPLCRNPFRNLDEKLAKKFAAPQRTLDERRFLRREELERLFLYLEKLGEEDYFCLYMLVLTKFLFFSGMRVGEVIQLRWKDIEHYSDQDGKMRWRVWFIGKGKTDYVSQKVPEECITLVHKLWRRRFERDPQPEEFVWMAPPPRYRPASRKRKSPRLSGPEAAGLYVELSQLVNNSGLFSWRLKLHPHYFRHNLAVYLRNELHWDPRKVQLILRHTSLETTTTYYFHDEVEPPESYAF